jgi:putative DNA primase/helicase
MSVAEQERVARFAAYIRDKNHPLTEDLAAIEFGKLYRDRLGYCHDRGSWLRWDGSIWRAERTGLAFHYARELARELSKVEDLKGLVAASKTAFAAGVERFARADPVFARTWEDWDQDPWLAGCPDGYTLDLKTGLLIPAEPRFGITKSLAALPDDRADCPRFLAFLDQTFGGDEGRIKFIQQYLGYSLTGDISEHALVFGYGSGLNGKTVLLNTSMGIFGDYGLTAPMDTFTAAKGDRHPTELAMLRGARFVAASEIDEGRHWDEARLKLLAGGDPITARFMHRDFFTYRPTFKLFIVGNHRPKLRNVDEANRRRFNILPFTFKPEKPDPELSAKLSEERPGILRWMIDGCLDWQANRLTRPDSVTEATESYFRAQDVFGQWLADRCDVEPGNTHKREMSSRLFENWSAFAKAQGADVGDTRVFADLMEQRGFESHRTSAGNTWRGIRLRDPERHWTD